MYARLTLRGGAPSSAGHFISVIVIVIVVVVIIDFETSQIELTTGYVKDGPSDPELLAHFIVIFWLYLIFRFPLEDLNLLIRL